MPLRHIIIASCVSCLVPALVCAQEPAPAADWASSFSAEALRPHMDKPERLLVVGASGADASAAALALSSGLRAAGAPLVMDGAALGDVSTLSDEAIVAKAAALPVDAVWVVRAFPAPPPTNVTAVALLYDRSSASLRYAVQATPGAPISPPPAAANTVSSGVDTRAKQEVAAAPERREQPTRSRREREELYKSGVIGISTTELYNQGGAKLGEMEEPFVGIDRTPISWPAFYERVGRDDLAEEYKSNEQTRTVIILSGTLTAILGGVVMLLPLLDTGSVGEDDRFTSYLIGGGVIMILGTGLLLGGGAYSPSVATPDENRRLARLHNEQLGRSLDLEVEASPEDASGGIKFNVAPMFHTPGLMFQLQF